ncbi:MAG: cytochrome C [Alphaproteobacteria bacterium]
MAISRSLSGALLGLLVCVHAAGAAAIDGAALVGKSCVSCHNLSGPSPNTFDALLKRRAPDLFYAGSKFNRTWLVGWLQKPTLIRPAGVIYLKNIVTKDKKDNIRKESVAPCPTKLSQPEAEAVADYLMTLKDPNLKAGVVDPKKKLRKHKALRLFRKKLPCIGCHAITFGKRTMGGVTGPDLRDAGNRLNPDWVYAQIENPQYWDPMTWMPRIEMSHRKREMLTLFIISMKQSQGGSK